MAQEATPRAVAAAKVAGAGVGPGPTSVEQEARRALVQQVLGSRSFAKSVRLAQFFEFVCGRALDGRLEEINEQQIGVHVFGRSPEYSANDDSIVRSQARLLRQRLEEYFETECPYCPMIVLIPKGGYVPVFERRPVPEGAAEAGWAEGSAATGMARGGTTEEAAGEVAAPEPGGRSWILVGLLVVVAVLVGVYFLLQPLRPKTGGASAQLWQGVFAAGRPVVLVPSDDGLVLSEEMRRAPVSLDDYLSEDYLHHLPQAEGGGAAGQANPNSLTADWLSSHQYTSTADLELAMRLSRLPQAATANLETRYARVLRLDDLKSSNVVLIGGIGANPWVGLYAPRLNFEVNYDWQAREGYVVNKKPQPGEQARYQEAHADGSVSSYGVVAYLPGMGGNGSALLFEGSGMAGTEAAASFPFNAHEFAAFAQKLGHSGGGSLPYFEVLLETRSLGGNASEGHVVAWRRVDG
jgi:hypothetical protein